MIQDIAVTKNVKHQGPAEVKGEAFAFSSIDHKVSQFDKCGENSLGDVRSILSRPKYYKKMTLLAGKFSDFISLNREFYDQVFSVSDRFSGAYGFRATTCFRIVVAAPPQAAGLLRVFYDPIAINLKPGANFSYGISNNRTNWRPFDFTAFTQLPGAELNFEDATALDYKIPYTSFLSFMPLTKDDDYCPTWLGQFSITDLLPIAFAVGTAEPTITIYTWLEDIEILGSINPVLTEIEAQAGEPEDVEVDGPLSGPLYKTSKALNIISNMVPSISSLAAPLSWASRLAANAVAAYGYSKPIDNSKTMRFWDTSISFQNNADGPDPCFSMGMLQDNSIKYTNRIGGTDVDEMSFAHLMSKTCGLARFNIVPSTRGRVYSVPLCPQAMYRQTSTDSLVTPTLPLDAKNFYRNQDQFGPGAIITPTIPFWLGMAFKKYRGTYKFTVKCNKTRFHGGRLMLVFTPFSKIEETSTKLVPGVEDTTGTSELSQYATSCLWDLRETNTCEFECPWIATTEYLQNFIPYGVFSIHVVDNLTVPESVSQSLDILVEVSGKDFDYEHPELNRFVSNPFDDHRSFDSRYAITSQSEDVSELCIGERLTSVKQVISRAEYYRWSSLRVRYPSNIFAKGVVCPHWFSPPCTMALNAEDTLVGPYNFKTIPYFCNAYAFARGGTCYEMYGPTTRYYFKEGYVGDNIENSNFAQGSVLLDNVKTTIKVRQPFYSDTLKVPVNPMMQDVRNSEGVLIRPVVTLKSLPVTRCYVANQANQLLTVRAADDAQLGFFLSAPRLMYTGLLGPIDTVSPPIESIGQLGGQEIGVYL